MPIGRKKLEIGDLVRDYRYTQGDRHGDVGRFTSYCVLDIDKNNQMVSCKMVDYKASIKNIPLRYVEVCRDIDGKPYWFFVECDWYFRKLRNNHE